jgi:hypothetical protein
VSGFASNIANREGAIYGNHEEWSSRSGMHCSTSAALAAGEGARYGTRDPVTCTSTNEPTSGPISPEMAKRYLTCHLEGVTSPDIFLVDNVQVQVGKGTPFLAFSFGQRPFNGDPDGQVYAIRGSYRMTQCQQNSSILENVGKNCQVWNHTNAIGQCYRTTFGDWVCNMTDLAAKATLNQPPPR